MKNLFRIFALLLAIGLFVVSCEVDDLKKEDPEEGVAIAEDNVYATINVSDVFALVNDGTVSTKYLAGCPAIEYTLDTKTLTINFGSDGCTGDDGIIRKGLITAIFSGTERAWEIDETVDITFTDYYAADKKLEGEITITCTSVEPPAFRVVATDMVLTFTDSKTVTWASDETIAREKKDDTGEYWRFNGTTTGVSRSGENFSRTSENLLSSPACKWFIDGTFTITVGDNTTAVTFLSECGKIKIKRNNLPEFPVTLN